STEQLARRAGRETQFAAHSFLVRIKSGENAGVRKRFSELLRAVADVNKCAPVGRRAAGAAFVVKPDAAGRERRHRADRTKIAKPQRVRAVVGKHDRLVEVRALRDQLLDEAVYLSSRVRRFEPDIAAPRLPEAVALRIEPLRCSDNMLREF